MNAKPTTTASITSEKTPPIAAPALTQAPENRCKSITERAQLGETLNDEERTYIKEKCQ